MTELTTLIDLQRSAREDRHYYSYMENKVLQAPCVITFIVGKWKVDDTQGWRAFFHSWEHVFEEKKKTLAS